MKNEPRNPKYGRKSAIEDFEWNDDMAESNREFLRRRRNARKARLRVKRQLAWEKACQNDSSLVWRTKGSDFLV